MAATEASSQSIIPHPRHDGLYRAADENNIGALKRYLKAGVNPDSAGVKYDGREDFPLMRAACLGHDKVVALLLQYGASVPLKKKDGYNALFNASYEGHLKIVKLLLATGVDVNIKIDSGYTPLIVAAEANHPQVVAYLLEAGADIHAKAGYPDRQHDVTALFNAAMNNNTECCRLLVEAGSCLDAVVSDGRTPLGVAAENGGSQTVRYLISVGADIETRDRHDMTPLAAAASMNNTECCRILVEAGSCLEALSSSHHTTPLAAAAQNGCSETVTYLISVGADIEVPNAYDKRPLAMAAESGYLEIVKALVRAGALLNVVAEDGMTALIRGCVNLELEVVHVLLGAGADVNVNVDLPRGHPFCGLTALYGAAQSSDPVSAHIVKALLEAGGKTNYKHQHFTPLAIACQAGHVESARYLLEGGANPDLEDAEDDEHVYPLHSACILQRADVVKLLLDSGSSRTRTHANGLTYLAISANKGCVGAVKLFLDTPEGAGMINMGLEDGRTPIMLTKSQSVLKVLLEAGASISCVDDQGNTALHWAVMLDAPPAALCTLIAAHVEVSAVNDLGLTAADLAMHLRRNSAETLLRRVEASGTRGSVRSVPRQSQMQALAIEMEDMSVEDEATQAAVDNVIAPYSKTKKKVKKVKPCARCGEVTHRRCAGCKVTFYCCLECQKVSYAAHKMECVRIRDKATDVAAPTLVSVKTAGGH